MIQPFTSKQIKRFLLFYAAIILFVALFYLFNTAFNPVVSLERKQFATVPPPQASDLPQEEEARPSSHTSAFRLLPKE